MSSHFYFSLFYNDARWNPVKASCWMAGAQPDKERMWDAASSPRPQEGFTGTKDRSGWWRIALRYISDCSDRHDKRLCSNASHVMMLA